jgi:hypothetical protein
MGVGLYSFGYFLDKDMFNKFPELLDVDDTKGYVTDEKSEFFGMRNAESEEEFVQMFFFVVLVHLSRVHAKSPLKVS